MRAGRLEEIDVAQSSVALAHEVVHFPTPFAGLTIGAFEYLGDEVPGRCGYFPVFDRLADGKVVLAGPKARCPGSAQCSRSDQTHRHTPYGLTLGKTLGPCSPAHVHGQMHGRHRHRPYQGLVAEMQILSVPSLGIKLRTISCRVARHVVLREFVDLYRALPSIIFCCAIDTLAWPAGMVRKRTFMPSR